ncbi:MAG: phosphate ABC transporter substrate-binding protein PstS [Mycobacteriales bacterium]
MQLTRTGSLVGVVLSSALALTACGSGNNTSTSSASSAGSSPTTGSSAGASASSGASYCATGSLSGQGSTFQQNAELQWIKDYAAKCSGAQVSYQGTGSGAGKSAFGNGTADFGGTDSLPKPAEQAAADKRCGAGNKGILTPVVAGAVVLTYNLPGVSKLVLSPATAAGLFQGTIKTWNDAALKADNPGVSLPSIPVVPVHRSEKSGTTKIFSGWLKATAKGAWTLGSAETLTWPGGQSAKGSDGTTTAVAQSKGGVTYTELSFAKQRSLPSADIKNASGAAVTASGASVSAALSTAKVDTSAGDIRISPDYATTTAAAYPLAAPSYVLTCDKGNKNAALLKGFLTYALSDGKAALDALGYAPLPDVIGTQALAQAAKLS